LVDWVGGYIGPGVLPASQLLDEIKVPFEVIRYGSVLRSTYGPAQSSRNGALQKFGDKTRLPIRMMMMYVPKPHAPSPRRRPCVRSSIKGQKHA
jgi:hypothetical protein